MMTESDEGSFPAVWTCSATPAAVVGQDTTASERPVLVSRFRRFSSLRRSAAL